MEASTEWCGHGASAAARGLRARGAAARAAGKRALQGHALEEAPGGRATVRSQTARAPDRRARLQSPTSPCPKNTTIYTYPCTCTCLAPRNDIHNKTLRTDAQTLGPRNCPAHLAPHTFSGARDGVLVAVAAVKTRRIDLHVPRNGSGEPARAWSPAWDTVVRGSLLWLPARVMSVLPRWHTQRCGRCLNSRYLYGQRRALPLSSSTCSART